jgi:arylsulfatase A
MVKTKGYISDVFTDAAIQFIERNKERSFFCYVPYNAPHSPFQVPDKYFDKYKNRGLDDKTACVHGMVENLDDNIGRILKRLDELKLSDNTIVLFLTDNGPNSDRYNGGMKGRKGSVHEGGIRVPLFIHWPGHIKLGTKVTQIAAHIDMFATIIEKSTWVKCSRLGSDAAVAGC